MTEPYRIAVLAGDGIGPEVVEPTLGLLEAATARAGGRGFAWNRLPAGAGCYLESGEALPAATLAAAEASDAILLGAMGLPSVRYPDGTEISPQLDLRFRFGLYAGIRPLRRLPGLPPVLADPRAERTDFVLVRESTEGLFATRGKTEQEGDHTARDGLVITRAVSERLFAVAFRLAAERRAAGHPGKVTLIDKANVLGSFAFFRAIFDETAARHPEIETERLYVDAAALRFVQAPWSFDVAVTENMFGDILSDLGAGLIGGMGMAPSADIGEDHAVFQPSHGSAPDIAGSGRANPTATILSGAMMLEWLGARHGDERTGVAGRLLQAAVERAFADGTLRPYDLGGMAGTAAVAEAVAKALAEDEVG